MTVPRTLVVVVVLILAGCLGGSGATNAVDEPGTSGDATTTAGASNPTTGLTSTATPTLTPTPTETRSVPVTSYDSRESLVEAAPFAVPDPDVPTSFAFDSGIVSTAGNMTHVSLAYHHVVGSGDDAELQNVLSVGKFAGEALDLDQGETVTVDGREMQYVEDGDHRTLLWRCGDYTYRVSIQLFDESFDRDDLDTVAGSVDCPDGATEES